MASSDSQRQLVNDKCANRENQMQHFATISKSIGKIVKNTSNDQFKSDVCNVLNVKPRRRKKTIQTETMKLMKANYQQTNHQMDENRSNEQTNDKEVTAGDK